MSTLYSTVASSSSFENRPSVAVCGGCGFIGSHTSIALLQAGYNVVVLDNLVNSNVEAMNRIQRITNCATERLTFINIDLCQKAALKKIFSEFGYGHFVSCIHFAGLKAVGESVAKPLLYYENNLISTFNLIELCDEFGCTSLVFSSSATVYGSAPVPITEETQTGIGITNAYGRTKYMIEEILHDFVKSKQLSSSAATGGALPFRVTILRYFNPVGAHPSGLVGEDPCGVPNNLMPFVAQVAVGRRAELTIFGNDYDTPDGTGVRDYIHVLDLAEGHVAALKQMGCAATIPAESDSAAILTKAQADGPIFRVYNLGTGRGYSVLEMVAAMEKACGHKLATKIGQRRAGDIAICYANAEAANRDLNWTATRSLDDMCADLWRWQMMNPNGFNSA